MQQPFDPSQAFSLESLVSLITRLDLWSKILYRQEQENILACVELKESEADRLVQEYTAELDRSSSPTRDLLTSLDIRINACLPEALRLYSHHQFSQSIEERYLSLEGSRDSVIYSLIRSTDFALVRELWIRLEEGESSFTDLASQYSEGSESARKGVFGPIQMQHISPPLIPQVLRTLKPGQVHPPFQIGEWFILLRLEELKPAQLDDAMRSALLSETLSEALDSRVADRLNNISPPPLHYSS